ncbi:hypothetical protein [Mycolicibacterium goodii]|uniref:hypothetical protein n=1 Tax=Mycolicibacterium goodii TaxID=134601 RepID=UPI0012FF9C6E
MSEPNKFYEFIFGTDDPNIRYVDPDGYAPSIAFRVDGKPGTRAAKVLVDANADFSNELVEAYLYMDSAQLRTLAEDALRAAELLDA